MAKRRILIIVLAATALITVVALSPVLAQDYSYGGGSDYSYGGDYYSDYYYFDLPTGTGGWEPPPPPPPPEEEPKDGEEAPPPAPTGNFEQFCEENAPGATYANDQGTRTCTYSNSGTSYSPVPPYPLVSYNLVFGYRLGPGEQTPQWFEETTITGCVDTSGPDPTQGTPLPLDDPACVLP
jgi:hypothetical protein